MVKKLSAGLGSIVLVATMVVLLGASPSSAAGTVVVQGHNLPAANLFEFRDRCSSSTANPPAAQPLGLRSGSVGSHSIGWQFGAGDYEVGALAPVNNPETAQHHRGRRLQPEGRHERTRGRLLLRHDAWLHRGLLGRLPAGHPHRIGLGHREHRRARPGLGVLRERIAARLSTSDPLTLAAARQRPRRRRPRVRRCRARLRSRRLLRRQPAGRGRDRPDVLRLRGRAVRLRTGMARPEQEGQEGRLLRQPRGDLRHQVQDARPRVGPVEQPGLLGHRLAVRAAVRQQVLRPDEGSGLQPEELRGVHGEPHGAHRLRLRGRRDRLLRPQRLERDRGGSAGQAERAHQRPDAEARAASGDLGQDRAR